MSIIKEARELAKKPGMNPITADYLLQLADMLHEAYDMLKVALTEEHSRNFVAAYTRVHNCVAHIKSPPVPPKGKTNTAMTEPLLDTKVVASL